MNSYVTLLGAEDVRRAASIISEAASSMRSVAGQMEDSLMRHRIYLDDWLMKFEQALQSLKE